MICPYCGTENVDGAPFCADCGRALDAETPSNQPYFITLPMQPKQPEQSTAVPQAGQPVQPPQPAQPAAAAPSVPASAAPAGVQPPAPPVPPQPGQPMAAAPAPAPMPQPAYVQHTYAQGCMGAAWSDIVSSSGWFGRMFLLGLIQCVPILNFYVQGYAMRWGRQLFYGKIEKLPKKICAPGSFSLGFYGWVAMLVYGLVAMVAEGVFGFFPLIGALVSLAVMLAISVFEQFSVIRVALSNTLGPAFDIGKLGELFKRKPGEFIVASLVPSLIIGAIVCVIAIIVSLVFMVPLAGTIIDLADPYASDYAIVNAMLNLFVMLLPMMLVLYVVCLIPTGFSTVWTMRAVGHFVARYAQDWHADPKLRPNVPFEEI